MVFLLITPPIRVWKSWAPLKVKVFVFLAAAALGQIANPK